MEGRRQGVQPVWRSYNPFDLSLGFQPGDIISYMEMCAAIGVNLQRGMNFRPCEAPRALS